MVSSLSCQGCACSKVKECAENGGRILGGLSLLQNPLGPVVGVTVLKRVPAFGAFPWDCASRVGLEAG